MLHMILFPPVAVLSDFRIIQKRKVLGASRLLGHGNVKGPIEEEFGNRRN